MPGVSCVLIGNESLLAQCGEALVARGGTIARVVTRNPELAGWAAANGIATEAPGRDLGARLSGLRYDWLLSIANLDLLPDDVLATPTRGAINFHDGPLPAYAGLNAPVWALIDGEKRFGVTWHVIEAGADKGDIVAQEMFDIAARETALTLNTKCYDAAMRSFERVLDGLMAGTLARAPQDLTQRSYFARDKRPAAAGRLDFTASAETLARQVRALDHGDYWNPLTVAKFEAGGRVWLVGHGEVENGHDPAAPGTVLDIRADQMLVATGDGALLLSVLKTPEGVGVDVVDFVQQGEVLASPDSGETAALDALMAQLAPHDGFWRKRLTEAAPATLALAGRATGAMETRSLPLPDGLDGDTALAALAGFATRLAERDRAQIAYRDAALATLERPGYCAGWVPVVFDARDGDVAAATATFTGELDRARSHAGLAPDLALRAPEIGRLSLPDLAIAAAGAGAVDRAALTLALDADGTGVDLHADSARVEPGYLDLIAARLGLFLREVAADPARPLSEIPVLPDAERILVLQESNKTDAPVHGSGMIHADFEHQVAQTPDATALVFEDRSLSYDALNRAANRAAHVLIDMGVRPGQPVALHVRRGPNMMIGALSILKAGGAYVPLDPDFPAARRAHYLADSGARVMVSEADPATAFASVEALALDTDPRLDAAADSNPDTGVSAQDLAYLIYTSGSTGTPKGVMVEHRNVANFFTGMDALIDHQAGATWLALTSLSFDISVLELFWTLARGFKLVLTGDDERTLVAPVTSPNAGHSDRHMDFSLFFWGNDDGVGRKKYQLLLEGAQFADAHGFRAVWTPERHFHAFGGPYPNPSVTGAAVAAVTRNLDVRAGSCVAPLHHPARIAEEWAVIDNLTEGRVGLGIAAGWQPHDFVLRPQNSPPANKPAMYEAIDTLRRLWRGEEVEFAMGDASPHAVVSQPRPVSKDLPIWVTTAGNPDTWREAGEIGANVLTHLLGQSVDEVRGKIEIYHDALRKAGHDPADFTVTLMLHSFLADDRETARAKAEGPMKDYLSSAAGLIKQFAWVFPAFKRPTGVSNAFELDLEVLEPADMEAILDFAFTRYFEDSGLFGTVEDALARTEQLKAIGVDEIACLVDYGITPDEVMGSLKLIAEVVAQANRPVVLDEGDFSLAAQIRRHQVSHLQATPSMMRMLIGDDAARGALGQVEQILVGGEPLPGALVRELERATHAQVTNMYGPTETTIWSSAEPAAPCTGIVNIGRPIANTSLYVLDQRGRPVPVGVAGELYIGGAGVTRGYWQREALSDRHFLPDPFRDGPRMYRTGDLVRRRLDGRLDFLGRTDTQVKLRGYRIELGEIEARLDAAAHGPAVVLAREDVPGDARLVAYLAGPAPDDAALKSALARDLPAYMVPSQFVRLDTFPLTPNHKIDRGALPAPTEIEDAGRVIEFAPPADDVQRRIAEIWSRILGVARIGARDNFFDLGGHSLLAVQAHREIKSAFGLTSLSITDVFRRPTLSGLAELVAGDTQPDGGDDAGPAGGERAQARADAMSRRRAMRANRRR